MGYYKIIRFFAKKNHPQQKRVMQTGLTLEQAQKWCNDPSTRKEGVYFDGYTKE